MGEQEKRNIGDVLNELSIQHIPCEFEYLEKKFKVYVKPVSLAERQEYRKLMKEKDTLKVEDLAETTVEDVTKAVNYILLRCVKDETGAPLWKKEEDIKLAFPLRSLIQNRILPIAFGFGKTDFAEKNLPGSPS